MSSSSETGSGQKATIDFDHVVSLFGKSSYAEQNTWAPIAYSIVLGFGKLTKPLVDDLARDLLQRTSSGGEGDQEATPQRLTIFRALREAFLKGAALAGFPRTINACSYLQSSLASQCPAIEHVLKQDTSIRTPIPRAQRQARGWAFFSSVYGEHAEQVLKNLNESSGGDLGEFALNSVYADLVSETSILSDKETEMLQFICCLSLGRECGPQAKGHMHGAYKMGNSGEELRSAIIILEYLAGVLNVPWSRSEMKFLEKVNDW